MITLYSSKPKIFGLLLYINYFKNIPTLRIILFLLNSYTTINFEHLALIIFMFKTLNKQSWDMDTFVNVSLKYFHKTQKLPRHINAFF